MQKLRSTFKRSRTPTGAEMKSQSSLEVPKQVRSASFDEIQLEAQRHENSYDMMRLYPKMTATTSSSSSSCSPARSQDSSGRKLSTLRVPQFQTSQRSKSVDVCEKNFFSDRTAIASRKPDTPIIQVSGCYHCACVEEYKNMFIRRDDEVDSETDDVEPDDDDEDISEFNIVVTEDDDDGSDCSRREGSPEIRVTLLTSSERTSSDLDADSSEASDGRLPEDQIPEKRERRKSISKLARQEALTTFPPEFPVISTTVHDHAKIAIENDEDDDDENDNDQGDDGCSENLVVRDIFLTVPELKRDRAASVDSCFNNNKNGKSDTCDSLAVPQQSMRSKSVDIVLPTEIQTRYTALLPGNELHLIRGGREDSSPSSQREPRSTPDWGPSGVNGEHLWIPTAASGDFCYINDCNKHGPRIKCAACHVVIHSCCAATLTFECKPSFRDVGVRQYREQTATVHHWVHRRSQKGKCSNCGKSFQSKLSFSSKEIIAVSCSWCKVAYHNKESCFTVDKIGESCELGHHSSIIVPPSWIVKLPRKGSFKSSLRKSPRKKKSGGGTGAPNRKKSKDKDKDEKDQGKLWVVKPIPSTTVKPVLVFINPKSGGNQGAKLLQKFQWLLNPRQVFDLTQGGPKMGLELFKRVPNLRVLACGGDGTVGWVLSVLDQIGLSPAPAVGTLPLGTGNDLARALGWGGGYTDEPIGKILMSLAESETTLLDRWQLTVERNTEASNDEDASKGKENLPLNVVNNYYSLGVDAHIALEFHEAREAHPERFNSRLRNKMFYGQMGGKDLVRRKWKDLSEFVTLECDGQDMTPKLKEHRVHAIVFLNIASYGGGTHPWGGGVGREPSTDDGLIEVVGLTTYQLPLLQAGGHGTSIAQCSTAKVVTTKTIPMQVDGEACRLLPSIINLSLLNKATMLAKRRNARKRYPETAKLERLKLPVMRIKMSDYETYHSDKDRLKKAAIPWITEPLDLDATMDLEALRIALARNYPNYSMDTCCFLDSCTAERFFRVDRAQEQLHYVTDVANDVLYVLEEGTSQGSTEMLAAKNPISENVQSAPSEERRKSAVEKTHSPSQETSTSANRSIQKANQPKPESTPATKSDELSKKTNQVSMSRTIEVSSTTAQETSSTRSHEVSFTKTTAVSSSSKIEDTGTSKKDERRKDFENEDLYRQGPSKQGSSRGYTSTVEHSQQATSLAYISPRDRLFGLSSEVHTFSSELLEKKSEGLIRAAKMGDLPAFKELHGLGYSLLSIDINGQTSLHFAARLGYTDIVRYLIASAPPTLLNMIENAKGQTALHKAAQNKRRTICCMLVAGGATLTIKDRQGNTPRQLALLAEDRELAAYLHSQEQFQLVTEEMDNIP